MRENNILSDIYNYIGRFVVFPDKESQIATTAWIAHTHLMDAFDTTPRLHVTSAVKGCGKTRLLQVIELLVPKALSLVSPSPASLYTLIQEEHPTLLIDEVDRLFAKKDTSDITAIVNSGFQRGARVPRVSQEPTRKVEYFDVFGQMLISGIDKHNMPDTIADRSIQIRLKRRLGGESIEPFRLRKNSPEGHKLRDELAMWSIKLLEDAKKLNEPMLPSGIEDRKADVWEPLFIVADAADASTVADKTWGVKIREAALSFVKSGNEAEQTGKEEQLLIDIRAILTDEKMSSDNLLSALVKLPEGQWSDCEWGGRSLSTRGLARLLKPFGIKPKQYRFDGVNNTRGYMRSDFEDAWKRHLPATADLSAASDTGDTTATSRGVSFTQHAPTLSATRDTWPSILSTTRTPSDDNWGDRWIRR
jgi:hypothetical protein